MDIKKVAILGVIVAFIAGLFITLNAVDAHVSVKGYHRSNGTYV